MVRAANSGEFVIREATGGEMAAVAALFREYSQGIGIDLGYQGFADELATLPGAYAAPRGVLLMAVAKDGHAVGCVAVRPMAESNCCEMKRLHVRREARGSGLGRALAERAIGAAARIGYARMRLDTLATMTTAQALYRKLGFSIIAPYYDTPIAGTVFMEKVLAPAVGVAVSSDVTR